MNVLAQLRLVAEVRCPLHDAQQSLGADHHITRALEEQFAEALAPLLEDRGERLLMSQTRAFKRLCDQLRQQIAASAGMPEHILLGHSRQPAETDAELRRRIERAADYGVPYTANVRWSPDVARAIENSVAEALRAQGVEVVVTIPRADRMTIEARLPHTLDTLRIDHAVEF